MVNNYQQLSFAHIYTECKEFFQNDKPKFLSLLSEHLDLNSLIPDSFRHAYYKHLGRDREYSLVSMLASLILQKILGIPTVSLLRIFLLLCKEAREFCGFDRVPDNSQFTRFKQNFVNEIENLFNKLVDITEPLCQQIDSKLASMTIFDTSGIEAYVTENNPKFLNSTIRRLKRAYKNNPDVDVYKMAYALMPSSATANKDIKQLFINGHFCYVYKFAIITNGLGIVRNITFLDEDFKANHPEIEIDKKSDSPDEDKSISDSKALKPVLTDYFKLHPDTPRDTFLGDSIFDTYETYPFLLNECGFNKALIPLNMRNSKSDLEKPEFDDDGRPLCPRDGTPFKFTGHCNEKGRSPRDKWECPKAVFEKGKRKCLCDNPCTKSPSSRMIYTYPHKDLRTYPGTIRGTQEWDTEYNTRGVVEQTINYFKEPMAVGNLKTRDRLSIKADLFLAGITQLITVILADKLHKPECLRSIRQLIA
jgi:hypothetical protein